MREHASGDQRFDFDGDYGAGYEALARALIPGYLAVFDTALALLERRLGPDAHVLVVGAGTGIEIVTFAAAQPSWRFTGVDPSEQMIEIARRRIEGAGIETGTGFGAEAGSGPESMSGSEVGSGSGADRVDLHHGVVCDLSPDFAFSAATCFNVLHFLPDDGSKARLLADIGQRLEPGAPLLLFDLHGDPGTAEFEELYSAWRSYWRIRGMEEEACDAFDARLQAGIRWVPETRIYDLLGEAGFETVRVFFRGLLYGGWIARRRRSPPPG